MRKKKSALLINNCVLHNLKLYANIDLKLWNKLHGQMHYEVGVTCVFNGHGIYTHCNNTTN